MWLKNKVRAFVLAESMVALVIIVISTTWFFLVESQLGVQHQRSVERLMAARLAKETADEAQLTGRMSRQSRGGLQAVASHQTIRVYRGKRLVLEVK